MRDRLSNVEAKMIGQAKPTEFETKYLILQERAILDELGPGPARDRHLRRLEDYHRKLFEELRKARGH